MPWAPKRHNPRPNEKPAPRLKTAERLYGSAWQRASKAFRQLHPLCAECDRKGHVALATCVDHIEPHKGDLVKFWQQSNWQSLCARHHSQKTSREGAFGNPMRPAPPTTGRRSILS